MLLSKSNRTEPCGTSHLITQSFHHLLKIARNENNTIKLITEAFISTVIVILALFSS